jgi:hypothetical protein
MSGSTELRCVRRPIYNSVEITVKGLSFANVAVLCATDLRPLHAGGIDPLIRVAGDAGATGIHLAGSFFLGDLAPVATAVLQAGQIIPSMALPLGPRALASGKRLPALAADDPEERGAAIGLSEEGMAAGASVGVGWGLLDFGPVKLPVSRQEVAEAFARRALGEGEDFTIARGARKSMAEGLVDACRWSLERLCRQAESRGCKLMLPIGASPWEVPSPREALSLLEAFQGAPLALAWDPGRLSALLALGLPLPAARIEAVAKAAGAAIENDAVGMEPGYLPGLGERHERLPARPSLPAGAPVIVTGSPEFTAEEIADAVGRIAARYEAS